MVQRYPRGGSSYLDIHDQEVLDSLSDRPLKGEGRLECQRASIIEFTRPDSTVPILGTSSDRTRPNFHFGIRAKSCACPTPGECRAQGTFLPFLCQLPFKIPLDFCRKFGRVSPVF
ncbi:hypothetical protein Prudu_366S000600 [Prunus dulcis]|uniref:Uncharacterized protein n=1 Tax=Prunus dulcis TaxID=3755 RepID=A0A5H2Y0M0_PRUDU|nr:hypothetical protein Prudu_366S000600 [Prunus dulcis]